LYRELHRLAQRQFWTSMDVLGHPWILKWWSWGE
jgi:hypothetical protein